jgi:hypothetical protein
LRSSLGGLPPWDGCAVSGARDRSFPIGRRSAVDRIAPSVLLWRCCRKLSPIFGCLRIINSDSCTQF